MVLLLTIRHSSHEWSPERSQEEKLTDINPSRIEATSRQATCEQKMYRGTNSCTKYPMIPYNNRWEVIPRIRENGTHVEDALHLYTVRKVGCVIKSRNVEGGRTFIDLSSRLEAILCPAERADSPHAEV
jgi:hypothetical protein